MADYTKILTTGAKYLSSSGRHNADRLMAAIGTTNGKLNNVGDVGGIVNEYLAAMPYKDRILADLEAKRAAGVISSGDRSTILRGFNAADRTKAVGDQIAGYLDDNLPNRLPNLSRTAYTPPQGNVLDLSQLNAHPADAMGTPQSAMWLPVSHQFDMQDFTSRMTPERIGALRKLAQAGADIGGNTWYNMTPVQQKFIEHFGPEAGQEMFRDWAGRNAVLSPRSSVVDQTVRQSQLDYLKNMTGGYPGNAELKAGSDTFGHLANDVHVKGLENWDELGDLIKSGARPKIGSYFQNYLGNWLPGTMDTHHFAAAGLSESVPSVLKKQLPDGSWVPRLDEAGDPMTQMSSVPIGKYYEPLELASAHMAARLGLDPAQFQSSVWTGLTQRPDLMGSGKQFVPRTADPFAAIYDKVLTDSAGLRGTDPDQHFSDVATMQDYLTRPRGVAKSRNFDMDAGEGYAGGGSVIPGIGALKRMFTAAAEPMGIVKNNNGQWLGGNVQRFLEPLMKSAPNGSDLADIAAQLKTKMADPGFSAMAPEHQAQFTDALSRVGGMQAHNDWMNKVLGKTIQNNVAAPSDPFRALADQGITHFPTTDRLIKEAQLTRPYTVASNRRPLQDRGQLTELAETDAGRAWERLADQTIEQHNPSWFSQPVVDKNPWINNVDSDTPIHHIDIFSDTTSPYALGLQHISDAVTRHIADKSTTQNLSVEKAIRAAHDWHQQQLAAMAKDSELAKANIIEHNAKLGGIEHPNGITQYDYTKGMNPDDVAYGLSIDTATADHCVGQGSYDNDVRTPLIQLGSKQRLHPDNSYVKEVLSGDSNITSFRDKNGNTLATIQHTPEDHLDSMPEDVLKAISEHIKETPRYRGRPFARVWSEAADDLGIIPSDVAKPMITQISGPNNGHVPIEAREAVQNFLNSRPWADNSVPLGNTGLIKDNGVFVPREPPTPVGPTEDVPFAAGGQVRKAA